MRNAEEIFDAALAAGAGDCDWSIVVKNDGAIQMISGADWPLESLRAHHGASAVYRVERGRDCVRVEARNAAGTCVFTSARPERALARPWADFPQYLILN